MAAGSQRDVASDVIETIEMSRRQTREVYS